MAIENDEIMQGLEKGLCELKNLLYDFALRKIDKPQILAEVSIQKEILNFLELYIHVLESPAKKALIKLNIIGESISDVTRLKAQMKLSKDLLTEIERELMLSNTTRTDMVNVFIHGNMRSGGKDNKFISGAELLGRAETDSDFALVLIKGEPYVTKRPVSKIKGEVYSVDYALLELIDRLNRHARITRRELVDTRLEDGRMTEAWVYFYTEPLNNSVLVESGEYCF